MPIKSPFSLWGRTQKFYCREWPLHGVTGDNASIFRVQDGASFDGSGMTLISNGNLSTAVLGSGDNTTVTTGNAIFNRRKWHRVAY
ncbi:hypothetical protein LZ023_38630 (plasmid) [Pseudomonas silvicola]|nr:hypothetical protein LZ023_38630 [Pseudomonas silvicola]